MPIGIHTSGKTQIAVFSDIHANYEALLACLKETKRRGITKYIFLGDYLGEHAYPERTMKILYEMQEKYECEFIVGNKEEYWLHYRKNGESVFGGTWRPHDSTTGALYYTYQHITEKDIHFFGCLPISKVLTFKDHEPITICHGSPRKSNEHIRDDEAGHQILEELVDTRLTLCGHRHIQLQYEHLGKMLVNAGSIGVSYGCGGDAQFVILSSSEQKDPTGRYFTWNPELITLSYEKERAIAHLHESGLYEAAPGWTKVTEHLVRYGEPMHITVLTRVQELTRAKEPDRKWPDLPEDAWEKACEELESDPLFKSKNEKNTKI